MENTPKSDEEIKAIIAHQIQVARTSDDDGPSSRDTYDPKIRAIDYYNGDMSRDTPPSPNRSSVISNDTRDMIGWIMPGLMRTFLGSECIVEYEPEGPEDDEGAQQASDYVTHVFMKRNNGYRVVYNACHDALLQRRATLKAWWDDTEESVITKHTGLDEDSLAELLDDPDVEVLAHTEREEPIAEAEQAMMMQAAYIEAGPEGLPPDFAPPTTRPVHDVKIKRIKSRGRLRATTIPPENYIREQDSGYLNFEEPRFEAHREEVTRSQLLERGFDPEKVRLLASYHTGVDEEEEIARHHGGDNFDTDQLDHSQDLIELYECYIRVDVDGDGVAETVQAFYAGRDNSGELLEWDLWEDESPFQDVPCFPVPHKYEGFSLADDTMELQRVKTTLIRQALDNTYAHNKPRPIVRQGSVVNRDALVNAKFGEPIIINSKASITDVMQWHDMPFVADKTLGIMEYLDDMLQKRTGVSKSSMALDPDVLQNQTATAAQLQHDSSYSKQELIARNMAELGFKPFFRKLLRLIVKHQDRVDTIRLRGEWVEMNPDSWNADMDCTVNIGLGTGSRDRDMSALQAIGEIQRTMAQELNAVGMSAKALEFGPKIRATAVKFGEAAGLRNADDYFPDFTEDDVRQAQKQAEEAAGQEDPKIQIEREKLQIEQQSKQQDMQLEMQRATLDQQLKQQQMQAEIQLKREQLAAELELKREQMGAELALKREMGLVNADVQMRTSQVNVGGEPG